MYYLSTRDKTLKLSAAQAIVQGLAPDGGLLTPAALPKLSAEDLTAMVGMTYQERVVKIMRLFLEDFSDQELANFAQNAYGPDKFDDTEVAPVRTTAEDTHFLELWHGPTSAFKDMALQMLPQLLSASLVKTKEEKTACILVATSGDTGKAALEGFRDVDHTQVLVFYPRDGVSDIQRLQMQSQKGNNVGVCAVVGNFDDAQTGVKRIFSDKNLQTELAEKGFFLSSANSINWGRVLPQVVYYASAYCDLVAQKKINQGEKVNFCVPTGNFGNILAGYYAKQLGVPIQRLICASNANNVLTDFIRTGVYDRNRTFYTTTSPSMDILISSNLERMLYALSGENDQEVSGYMNQLNTTGRYQVSEAIQAGLAEHFYGGYCDDSHTKEAIGTMWSENNYLMDTHTAVAAVVLEQYRQETGDKTPTVVVSTASPFKFCDSVLDGLGVTDLASGTALLDQLTNVTGLGAPAPLSDLKNQSPRFHDCVEKEEMLDKVQEMLPTAR